MSNGDIAGYLILIVGWILIAGAMFRDRGTYWQGIKTALWGGMWFAIAFTVLIGAIFLFCFIVEGPEAFESPGLVRVQRIYVIEETRGGVID